MADEQTKSLTVNLVANGYVVCETAQIGERAVVPTNNNINVFEDFNGLVAFLRMEMGPEPDEPMAAPKVKK